MLPLPYWGYEPQIPLLPMDISRILHGFSRVRVNLIIAQYMTPMPLLQFEDPSKAKLLIDFDTNTNGFLTKYHSTGEIYHRSMCFRIISLHRIQPDGSRCRLETPTLNLEPESTMKLVCNATKVAYMYTLASLLAS